MIEHSDIRRVWSLTETVHNVSYFAPEGKAATDALSCKGMWMGHFGMYLATRLEASDQVSRRLWGDDNPAFAEAAQLARTAVLAAETTGRPLAAANKALPLPDTANLALWQSLTALREHRGDGHIALLTAAGIDSVQALILACGYGKYARSIMQPGRKWTDEQWEAGIAALAARGLVTPDGSLTDSGRTFRAQLEDDNRSGQRRAVQCAGRRRHPTTRRPADAAGEAGHDRAELSGVAAGRHARSFRPLSPHGAVLTPGCRVRPRTAAHRRRSARLPTASDRPGASRRAGGRPHRQARPR
jgi:hypothetical protein